MNAGSQILLPVSLTDITNQWDGQGDPAGYAFSIWGLIYSYIASFAVYQAIPTEWIGDYRNDDLIFNKIGIAYAANMFLNAMWLPIYQSNTGIGFFVAEIVIIFMLMTALWGMVVSGRMPVTPVELFTVRAPFSIYAGWLSAATILNSSYLLIFMGMKDSGSPAR